MSDGRLAGLTDFPRCGNNAPVIPGQRYSRAFGVLLLAVAVGLAPGCTLFDDLTSGTPFTPEQPKAEVTVVGQINIDSVTASREGCSAGRVLLWGIARNTGDLDVQDVFLEIDALGPDGGVLDTYRVNVFNGEVVEGTEATETTPGTAQIAGTSLAVDQSGTFEACTRLAAGSVAGTAYRADFIVVTELL